jgi:hypothetical protein
MVEKKSLQDLAWRSQPNCKYNNFVTFLRLKPLTSHP